MKIKYILLERLILMGVGFVTTLYLSKILSIEDFGILQYSLSIFIILFTAVSFGMESFIMKAYTSTDEIEYYHSAIIIRLGIAVIVCIIAFLLYKLLLDDFYLSFLISLSLPLSSFMIIKVYYQSIEDFRKLMVINVVSAVASLGAKLIIVIYFNINYFVFAFLVEYLVAIIFMYKKGLMTADYQKVKRNMSIILRSSFPILISSLSFILYTKIDRIMIGRMLGMSSVSIYSISSALIDYSIIAITIGQMYYNPKLTKLFNKVPEIQFNLELLNLTKLFVFLASVIIMIQVLIAPKLISVLFGERYEESIAVFLMLLPVIFIKFLGMFKPIYSVINNYQKIGMYTSSIALLLNIIFNYIFIKKFGFRGAAYATILSVTFSFYISNFLFKPFRKYFFIQNRALLGIFDFKNHYKNLQRVYHDCH